MVDAADGTLAEKTLDVARSIVITKLSNALFEEPSDSFNNIIYAILEKSFSMQKDTVERIIRYPNLDAGAEDKEFACKCLVSFRSRVHKHRVISQKAKLEPPTAVESIAEIPKEILDNEEELEVADEYAGEDEEIVNRNLTSASATSQPEQKANMITTSEVQNASVGKKDVKIEESNHVHATSCEAASSDNSSLSDARKGAAVHGKPMESCKLVEYDEDDAANLEEENTETSKGASTTINAEASASGILAASTDPVTGNAGTAGKPDVNGQSVGEEKSVANANSTLNSETNSKTSLPRLCRMDNHKEHFMNLPISWDGAPEFQWRIHNSSDRQTLVIENVLLCDITNVWLYPIILRASEIRLILEKQSSESKDIPGKMELKFLDDTVVTSCAINYLVHVRTSGGRRLKVFLPQTKTAVRLKTELEMRLGRVRQPNALMCQLIVKPVDDGVTEDEVRNVAFADYPIQHVEFKMDALKQRCVVITFSNASVAAAAHFANESVQFGEARGAKGWHKVFYPYTMMRYRSADGLLTKAEYKKHFESDDKKFGPNKVEPDTPEKARMDEASSKLSVSEEKDERGAVIKEAREQDTKGSLASPVKSKKEITKQKGQKRGLQFPNRGPSSKKPRRTTLGQRKGQPSMEEFGRRPTTALLQASKGRRGIRGRRGNKRSFRGGTLGNQAGRNDWRSTGGPVVTPGMSHSRAQPTPLLTMQDYEELQFGGTAPNRDPRTFPKKAKQKSVRKRPSLSSQRPSLSSQRSSMPSRFEHNEPSPYRPMAPRLEREIMMEERFREPRGQHYAPQELMMQRMNDDVEYPYRMRDNVGYGSSSSSGLYNQAYENFASEGYERGLEAVNDLPFARSYENDVNYDRNPWNSTDSIGRGGFGGRSGGRSSDYGYDRPRFTEDAPYGSVWR